MDSPRPNESAYCKRLHHSVDQFICQQIYTWIKDLGLFFRLVYRSRMLENTFVVDSLLKLVDTFDKSDVTVVKVSSQFIQQVTLRRSRRV